MSIGIEVNMVCVRNQETLWKSNDILFSLGTVLLSGYNIPRMKFLPENTKPGAVSTTNAKFINLYSAILSLKVLFSRNYHLISAHMGPQPTGRIAEGMIKIYPCSCVRAC